jgi:hypothetical protein
MAILDLRMNPSKGELRWFGLLLVTFSIVLGAIVFWHSASTRVPTAIVGVGLGICIVYYALRPLRLPIYRTWMRAMYPIGWLLSHIILISIYYLVLTPIGWVLRVVGYDPLSRRFDPEAKTYWSVHDPAERAERYFRQF